MNGHFFLNGHPQSLLSQHEVAARYGFDMQLNRSLNLGYGLARVAVGVVATTAPRTLGRTWIGGDADSSGATVILRAFGVRDLALGAGMVSGAMKDDADTWLATCALADFGDAAATVIGRKGLPDSGVRTTVALAGAGALAGIILLALNHSAE